MTSLDPTSKETWTISQGVTWVKTASLVRNNIKDHHDLWLWPQLGGNKRNLHIFEMKMIWWWCGFYAMKATWIISQIRDAHRPSKQRFFFYCLSKVPLKWIRNGPFMNQNLPDIDQNGPLIDKRDWYGSKWIWNPLIWVLKWA